VTSDGLADSVSSHVKKRRECESGLPRGGGSFLILTMLRLAQDFLLRAASHHLLSSDHVGPLGVGGPSQLVQGPGEIDPRLSYPPPHVKPAAF
jgi:hypothetical protein